MRRDGETNERAESLRPLTLAGPLCVSCTISRVGFLDQLRCFLAILIGVLVETIEIVVVVIVFLRLHCSKVSAQISIKARAGTH